MCFNAGELVAESLRLAQNALGEITGDFSADDLLGRFLVHSVLESEFLEFKILVVFQKYAETKQVEF